MRKVVLRKVGSSFVTTIPSELVDALHLKAGQKFEITKENGRLVLTPITPGMGKVMKAHEKVMQKYRAAFQRLADV